MSIEAGKYIAKILDHAISETKAGDPQAVVTFGFDGHKLKWYGSFKAGKAAEITIKALIVCGLKGNNPAGDLDIGKEVSITVADETGSDGVTRTKVKWVNSLGGGLKNVVTQDLARAKLSALEGAVFAARSSSGVEDTSDIPF